MLETWSCMSHLQYITGFPNSRPNLERLFLWCLLWNSSLWNGALHIYIPIHWNINLSCSIPERENPVYSMEFETLNPKPWCKLFSASNMEELHSPKEQLRVLELELGMEFWNGIPEIAMENEACAEVSDHAPSSNVTIVCSIHGSRDRNTMVEARCKSQTLDLREPNKFPVRYYALLMVGSVNNQYIHSWIPILSCSKVEVVLREWLWIFVIM